MRYNKNFKKKDSRDYRHYNDEVGGDPGRPPVTDGGGQYADMLSIKAMRDLPKSPVSLLADPYTSALPGTMPYPLLNRFNRVMGGRYSGEQNLDGGNVRQYANTYNTGFLNIFDSVLMKLHLNYRYLPILTDEGTGANKRGDLMIDEMRKAIAEATSVLGSTIFVNQNIYNYAIETDMPMGNAPFITVKDADNHEHKLYTQINDVIYAMSIIYQTYLQSVVLAFNQFNSFRMKQGEMIRMSFNRESPSLNSFFGLMNKKAFLSLWDSLAYTVEGEYIDQDFMVQTNVLGMIASRRSESLNDPLLEISSTFNFPNNFTMYATTIPAASIPSQTDTPTSTIAWSSPVFDLSMMTYTNSAEETYTFEQATNRLMEMMTANNTLAWARNLADPIVGTTENARYNEAKELLYTLTMCMTIFKTRFNDFRTVLDVMSRTGVNQWVKGLKLKVINDIDTTFFQNLVVDNIYSMVLSGADNISYNDVTKRWSSFTLWDQYYGIPEHDTYMGGAFLTMSTKGRVNAGSSNVGYLPLAFNVVTNSAGTLCVALNRNGFIAPISYQAIKMSTDPVLARLVPLTSQSNEMIRVPKVVIADGDTTTYAKYTPVIKSFLLKLFLQLNRLGSIPTAVDPTVVNANHLDSDLFAIYNFEVVDFTNEVISYARSKAVFRANAIDKSNLGFYGLAKGQK